MTTLSIYITSVISRKQESFASLQLCVSSVSGGFHAYILLNLLDPMLNLSEPK